ncbi:MAG: CCA tRNA nucleotidyltransferase [Deltaproteobacteria bacterium]|nr:CCA tRNA nucleotidyltransferase [Deltaproteobacteria bacterium]
MKNNIIKKIPQNILNLLKEIGKAAEDFGCQAYAAGGFVRDLFLDTENLDIDILIEKNAAQFAKKLAKKLAKKKGWKVKTHKKFGTASLIFSDNFKIDITSARSESYKTPAALPEVKAGLLSEDIMRRDFTINTILINITPKNFGEITDIFSGVKDIKNRTVKALHDISFIDDPTRILRGIKFATRFNFTIDPHTQDLIKEAVNKNVFASLSGKRFFTELKYILKEKEPVLPLTKLFKYNIIQTIASDIASDKNAFFFLKQIKEVILWYKKDDYLKWALYFMGLINNCDKKASQDICRHFEIPHNERILFCDMRLEAKSLLKNIEKNKMEYKKISVFKTELILYMMASLKSPLKKEKLFKAYKKAKNTKVIINGNHLIKLGVKPGPIFSEITNKLFEAKIKEEISTKEDEIDYIKKYFLHNGH